MKISVETLVPSKAQAEWDGDDDDGRCYVPSGTNSYSVKDHDWVLTQMGWRKSIWYCRRCRSIQSITVEEDT